MSSADGNGRHGPGAISAAEKAVGGGGSLPSPPPKPGAVLATSLAAQSVAEALASGPPPPPPLPTAPLSDEAVRARIARAGLRQFKRDYPSSGPVHTSTGDATARKVFERNTQVQRVDYISTKDADFPGTSEPKKYADIAKNITPSAAAATLGEGPLSAEESVSARRSATTAKSLADVSETQRNGGGKHARGALRTIASEALPPAEVYDGESPGLPQAKPGGMQHHRDVMSGAAPVTPALRTVVDHFSDSSDDEAVATLSPREAIRQYRVHTETAAVRRTLSESVAPVPVPQPQPQPQPQPMVTTQAPRSRSGSDADDEAEAPPVMKRSTSEGGGSGQGLDLKRQRTL